MATALIVLLLNACGKSKGSSSQDSTQPGSGCIQGVVVDGLTSQRVAVPGGAGDKGVFALVRNTLLPASPAVTGGTDPLLVGEYNLCGIPLDEDFPLLVWLDGYQPFESIVRVHSTVASRSSSAKSDLLRPTPIELANIRIYPINQQVKDLQVLVTHDGAPLAGVIVQLRAAGSNFLDPSGQNFLPPVDTRQTALTGTTDATGAAVFHADSLVLGGHYTYTIIPPNGGQAQTAVAAGLYVLGLRDDKDKTEPYRITVDLAHSIGPLVALSKSTDTQEPDASGKLTIYFNREIEIVPGTIDNAVASLSGNVTAQIADNVPANNLSEQVKLTVNVNVLTLEPVFKAKPDGDIAKEPGLQITYNGVQLRPKASPDQVVPVTLNETVHFYR